MKRILLIVACFATAGSLFAQENRIGVAGAYNSTWLFNKNVSDKNAQLDYASSFGSSFGFSYTRQLNDNYGISAELLYSSHLQKYDGEIAGAITYTAEDKLGYLDIPILFRAGRGSGAYFEIGPQLSFLMGAKESAGTSPGTSANYTDKDFKDDFTGFGLSGVIGFGADIQLNDALTLTAGVRLGYGLTDATTEYSKEDAFKLLAEDKLSDNALHNHIKGSDLEIGTDEFGYEKTSRVFGGLHLGLSYTLK